MTDWSSLLSVVGTLLGAVVAGGISLLVQRSSHEHARKTQELVIAEERARWAAERELDQSQRFYGLVDKLQNRMQEYRIARAWASDVAEPDAPRGIPEWVPDIAQAFDALDRAFTDLYFELPLLSGDFTRGAERISEAYWKTGREMDEREAVTKLQDAEEEIRKFKLIIAEHYREVFETRRLGKDHDLARARAKRPT